MSILFISHDLPSVANLCHRVAILHNGEVVELAPPAELFAHPQHPYTKQLVAALPRIPDTANGVSAH
jgi:ABC-type dipeptide/oligopeptide/nickel transport system ATPase component